MPVTGDFAFARKLADKIAALPELQPQIARVAGAAAMKQLNDEFNKSRNPYGIAWKPLSHPSKRRGGSSAKPLVDRGILKNSYSAQPTSDGFEVSTRTEYAAAHQYGAQIAPHTRLNRALVFDKHGRFANTRTKAGRAKIVSAWMGHATYANGITVPRRQMVPEPDTGGMGDLWGTAVNKASDFVVKAHFKAGE